MRILKITEEEYPEFDSLFEDSDSSRVEDAAPEVIDGSKDVKINGRTVSEYDAVFAQIPEKNAVFGRVLLEMMEEKGLNLNYPSTAFFIMSKKNYLYHVLHEKGIPSPTTVVAASEKAARSIENLEKPLVARKFDQLEEEEKRMLEEEDSVVDFMEGKEYPEEFIIFHEFSKGDKYFCLYIDGTVISLEDTSEGWNFSTKKLQYSSISNDRQELVSQTAKSIGSPVAEVMMRGDQVWDVNPNPDLKTYTEVSGKNAFEAVASVLKGD